MTRREALYSVSLMLGGTIVGAELFLQGCDSPQQTKVAGFFTSDEVAMLDEVAEAILPETPDSPGAKAANVGEFMQTMVGDCYSEEEQKIFRAGMKDMEAKAQATYQKAFMELEAGDRMDLLNTLNAEAIAYGENIPPEEYQKRALDSRLDRVPPHYFDMMKQLTILGFFTSEVGATKALRYLEVPGKYDGNYPYKPGDKAWAL